MEDVKVIQKEPVAGTVSCTPVPPSPSFSCFRRVALSRPLAHHITSSGMIAVCICEET